MAAASLELTLRRRLVGVLGPALVIVGGSTVGIVALVLSHADTAAAHERALSGLHSLDAEFADGEPPAKALDEVTRRADVEPYALGIRLAGMEGQNKKGTFLAGSTLTPGECATIDDAAGESWRACAVVHEAHVVNAPDGPPREAPHSVIVAAVSTKSHSQILHAVAIWSTAAVLLTLLFALAAARASLRRPLASLKELVVWSERLDADERPAKAPIAEAPEEIAHLATAFDALVARLFDALERERASSAHIAHELRTPLTSLRAELEALPSSEVASRMIGDVDRLARAIDAILVLSNPPSSQRDKRLIVNVADVARELAPEHATIDVPDEALVEGDEHLIVLALQNVIENAQRYAGGATKLIVAREDDTITLSVRDRGAGLDATARERAFDRHWRGTKTHGGSGLGLALVRAVAERHGGSAVASENPEGQGLEIRMTFRPLVGWHA